MIQMSWPVPERSLCQAILLPSVLVEIGRRVRVA
jgi:hypothetical protein